MYDDLVLDGQPMRVSEDDTPRSYGGGAMWVRAMHARRDHRAGGDTMHRTTPPTPIARLYRQGDVLIIPADAIPEGAKPVRRDAGRVVLAYGEVTGHAHAIASPDARLLELRGERFLEVTGPAELGHEEHATIALEPGTYRVVIQREYVPADEIPAGFRRVVD